MIILALRCQNAILQIRGPCFRGTRKSPHDTGMGPRVSSMGTIRACRLRVPLMDYVCHGTHSSTSQGWTDIINQSAIVCGTCAFAWIWNWQLPKTPPPRWQIPMIRFPGKQDQTTPPWQKCRIPRVRDCKTLGLQARFRQAKHIYT